MLKGGDPANENFMTVLIWICTIFWHILEPTPKNFKDAVCLPTAQTGSIFSSPCYPGMTYQTSETLICCYDYQFHFSSV